MAVPCFHPLTAYRTEAGDVVFERHAKVNAVEELQLPCGRCLSCLKGRAEDWAVRVMHEARMHEHSWFVTLTYSDEHLPSDGSLRPMDVKRFLQRLRRAVAPAKVRYFLGGEYGDKTSRPHYHAIFFGFPLTDLEPIGDSGRGNPLYRSATLERCWPHGFVSLGTVTHESARYVGQYCVDASVSAGGQRHSAEREKIDPDTGEVIAGRFLPDGRVAPFGRMSRRPGIGRAFLDAYGSDVFVPGFVVTADARIKRIPRYYEKVLESSDPDRLEELRWSRREYAKRRLVLDAEGRRDFEAEEKRLADREAYAAAVAKHFSRSGDV